mgnify:FL=1
MPAAVAVPLISTAVSAGTSIMQTSAANRQAKKTQQAIDNYKRQEIVNPNLALQVSTLGADRQREDLSRSIATMANQAAMGGSRSILGIAPNLLNAQLQQGQQIAGTLDQQEAQRQAAVAQGEGMVTKMTEERENADLAGLGNQLNVARQERANGVNNLIQTGFGAATLGLEMNKQGLFGGGQGTGGGSAIGIETVLPGAEVSRIPFEPMPLVGSIDGGTVFNKGNSFTQPAWMTNYNQNMISQMSALNPFGLPYYLPKTN